MRPVCSLAFCPGSNFTKSLDLLEDRVGGGGPYGGSRTGVMSLHEVVDGGHQIFDAAKAAAAAALLCWSGKSPTMDGCGDGGVTRARQRRGVRGDEDAVSGLKSRGTDNPCGTASGSAAGVGTPALQVLLEVLDAGGVVGDEVVCLLLVGAFGAEVEEGGGDVGEDQHPA